MLGTKARDARPCSTNTRLRSLDVGHPLNCVCYRCWPGTPQEARGRSSENSVRERTRQSMFTKKIFKRWRHLAFTQPGPWRCGVLCCPHAANNPGMPEVLRRCVTHLLDLFPSPCCKVWLGVGQSSFPTHYCRLPLR